MNTQKFTQKSLEAVQLAHNIAVEHNHMQIEQLHLLDALLTQENSLVAQLLKKMNVDPTALERSVMQEIGKIPSVTGSGREAGKVYISQDVDRALNRAEKTADSMKDEYVSVEHLMLGLMEEAGSSLKNLLNLFHIEKNEFLKVLQQVRGNTRVTSDSPEDTYDALKK